MDGLPAVQREVLALRLFCDLSLVDVARRLGIPPGTAYSRAHHGLRRLRAEVAARLRGEGLLPDCGDVRERLIRAALLGRAGGRAPDLRRHLDACAGCRREAALLGAVIVGVAAEVERTALVEAPDLREADAAAWAADLHALNVSVHDDPAPRSEGWVTTSSPAPLFTVHDGRGRVLAETRRWRHADGRWSLHYALPEPWASGAQLRLLTVSPQRVPVRRDGDVWAVRWRECPLASDDRQREALFRFAVRLPEGYGASGADPAPDRDPHGGRLVPWSSLLQRGQAFEARLAARRLSGGT